MAKSKDMYIAYELVTGYELPVATGKTIGELGAALGYRPGVLASVLSKTKHGKQSGIFNQHRPGRSEPVSIWVFREIDENDEPIAIQII